MSKYLIDHTAEYLQAAARECNLRQNGDMRVEVLCREKIAVIRGCLGGTMKTWDEQGVEWDVIATASENPLLEVIDKVLFRLERNRDRLVPMPGRGETALAK